jgi:type IV secretory pathway VirB10-like protein
MNETNQIPEDIDTTLIENDTLNKSRSNRFVNKYSHLLIVGLIIGLLGLLIYTTFLKKEPAKGQTTPTYNPFSKPVEEQSFPFEKKVEEEPLPMVPPSHVKPEKKAEEVRIIKGVSLIGQKKDAVADKAEEKDERYRGGNYAVAGVNRFDPNLYIPKGTYIPCSLKTRIVSSLSGNLVCTLSEDIYSANGNILLLEKGSTIIGSYKGGSLENGVERLFAIWNEVRTINNVVVNIESEAVGTLGAAGIPGEIDNHWWYRLGAAGMLSVIEIASNLLTVKISQPGDPEVYYGTSESSSNSYGIATTGECVTQVPTGDSYTKTITPVVASPTTNYNGYYPSQSLNTMTSAVNTVLQQFINIKPTLYKNHGDRVGILVNKDLDFSKVYRLREVQ